VIDRLEAEVRRRFGLMPRAGWSDTMSRTLDRYSTGDTPDTADGCARLFEDPDLLRQLAGRLTVDESYFLRHEPDFAMITSHLRAQLEQGRERVSVLSAGCAHGEEPYSVAITADRALGAAMASRIEILACDINGDAITTARRGVCRSWSLRGVPPLIVQRYFEPGAEATWHLRPELTRTVHFEHLAAQEQLERIGPGALDVILFRNVAIYLEPAALQHLYAAMAGCLRPGGLLVVAATDPRPVCDLLEPTPLAVGVPSAGTVLRRITATHPPAPPARPASGSSRPGSVRGPRPIRCRTRGTQDKPTTGHEEGLDQALERAVALADRGRVDEALALTAHAIERAPASACGYRLCGLIHLEQEQSDAAVEAFRSALFLASEDRLCRYWYAMALDLAGRPAAAERELVALGRVLATLPADTLLEDEQTTCDELRRAITAKRRTLR